MKQKDSLKSGSAMTNFPTLPPSITVVRDGHDEETVLARYKQLVENRPAPGDEDEQAKNYAVYWPKPPLEARAIPEGVMPLDTEDGGFDHDIRLERFFSKYAPKGVYAWGIGGQAYGILSGHYNGELRLWLRREVIISPMVIMAKEVDIVLIAEEQFRFSVIGAPPEIISGLEEAFGGADTLRQIFVDYVEDCGVGFGKYDRQWAWKYLIPWCRWDKK